MSNIFSIIKKHSFFSLPKFNRRHKTLISTAFTAVLLISIAAGGVLLGSEKITTNLSLRNLPPSLTHPFGTDWLGRDMLTRTVKGLTLSMGVGMMAVFISVFIALVLGMLAAATNKYIDGAITWLVDLFLSVPHLVALILISFTVGGGAKGVIFGVALTHWPTLTRVIRAEVLQLRSSEFVQVSRHLGKSRWWVATRHILPHLIPQLFVGLVLMFPHAVLHEASITFLGFGLSPHRPAIGIILSEAMRYLSTGMWWLAFFPGLSLFAMVRAFDIFGENLRMLTDPHSSQD
jgi:peptide/nickel transport system permease protein